MGYSQETRFSNIDFQIDYTEGFIKTANTYYALNETEVIDGSWKKTGKKIKKGETVTVEGVIYTIDDYIVAGYKGNWISADDVAIKDSDILPNYLLRKNRYNEIIWIADWYKDVINLSRKEAIRFINKKLPVTEDLYFADSDTYWYEDYASYPFGIDFTNVLLNIRFLGRDGYNFLIKRIEKKNQDYIITCFPTEIYDWSDISAKCTDLENFPNPTETFLLRISPLEDSIKVYNFETKELIVSLIPVTDKWVDLFQDFLKTGKKGNDMFAELLVAANDIATAASNPLGMEESQNAPTTEHTEEVAVSTPAPDMRKSATVTENLRLRTDDKTTAKVVATLAARTRVKVLAPGREDTIDGIASNWVQVEVLGGAKDKDDNTIEAGTKGWLFGGYLSETESADSESPNEDDVGTKKSSALPILPIAAGGAALAVLLAVILLVVAKKRKAKKSRLKSASTNLCAAHFGK